MRLSNRLGSVKRDKLTPDLSYLEQTSQLKQNLRNKDIPDLRMNSGSDMGVSDLQVGGSYGGISHGALTLVGQAALGALGGVLGGVGGGGVPAIQGYGMGGMQGMMNPGMMGGGMMTARMPPPGYMGGGMMRR